MLCIATGWGRRQVRLEEECMRVLDVILQETRLSPESHNGSVCYCAPIDEVAIGWRDGRRSGPQRLRLHVITHIRPWPDRVVVELEYKSGAFEGDETEKSSLCYIQGRRKGTTIENPANSAATSPAVPPVQERQSVNKTCVI
ncbi:hypothetical protein OH76DRAFT_1128275 [Lentinus brumalis]|uniref:Uncharacterized protein n=1 Tax=Lentinus brumalis TaxID=2498619 RepID=A0A371CUI4_9APHY|nr:hypothetical protein OH76DRAFT_1128275 [Polyporus brumalis]